MGLILTTWFTVRIPPCQIRTSTLLNVQNYIVFYHVVSHALFYIGNWVLHCFSQYKMHVRFLPNYFDFSALAPFSFVHQTSVSDIKYVIGETFPTCLLYAHANTWFLNRSLKPLWQGSLAAILSGSHFFKRPQEWSNVCVPARLLIVLAVCTGFVNCFTWCVTDLCSKPSSPQRISHPWLPSAKMQLLLLFRTFCKRPLHLICLRLSVGGRSPLRVTTGVGNARQGHESPRFWAPSNITCTCQLLGCFSWCLSNFFFNM